MNAPAVPAASRQEHTLSPAIAAIDQQIADEDARIHDARSELQDAQVKLEQLHAARKPLAKLVELYTGVTQPPPLARDVSDHITSNGNGNGAVKRAARRRHEHMNDAAFLDAVRSLGGRGTCAEVAGAVNCNLEAARRRLRQLVEAEQLDVTGEGKPNDPSVYSIPAPRTGSPDTDDEPVSLVRRPLEPGESQTLEDAVRRVDTGGTGEPSEAPKRASANLSRLPKREATLAPASARAAAVQKGRDHAAGDHGTPPGVGTAEQPRCQRRAPRDARTAEPAGAHRRARRAPADDPRRRRQGRALEDRRAADQLRPPLARQGPRQARARQGPRAADEQGRDQPQRRLVGLAWTTSGMSLPENTTSAHLGCGCSAHCRLCGCGDFHACDPGPAAGSWTRSTSARCARRACRPSRPRSNNCKPTSPSLKRHELIERHVDADQTLWAPTAKGLALKLDPGLKTRDELLRAQHVVRASDLLPPDWIATASARYESEHGREP
jgi:hypothetical protein